MDLKLAIGMARSTFRKCPDEADLFSSFSKCAAPLRPRFLQGRKALPEQVRACGAGFARVLGGIEGVYMPEAYAGGRRKAAGLHVASQRAIVLCAHKTGIAAPTPGYDADASFELIALQARFDRRRAIMMRRHTLIQLSKHTLERFLARESGGTAEFLAAMNSGLALAPALFRACELKEGTPMALPFADGLLLGELSKVTDGVEGEAQFGLLFDQNGVSTVRFRQPPATFVANMRTFVSHEMTSPWQDRLGERLRGILGRHQGVLDDYARATCFEEFDPPLGATDADIFAAAERAVEPAVTELAELVASPMWLRTVRQRPTTATHRAPAPRMSETPEVEAMAPAA